MHLLGKVPAVLRSTTRRDTMQIAISTRLGEKAQRLVEQRLGARVVLRQHDNLGRGLVEDGERAELGALVLGAAAPPRRLDQRQVWRVCGLECVEPARVRRGRRGAGRLLKKKVPAALCTSRRDHK